VFESTLAASLAMAVGLTLLPAASPGEPVTVPAATPSVAPGTPEHAAPAAPGSPPAALTPADASYLIGVNFGGQLRRLGVNDAVVLDGLARGMKDGLTGKRTSPEEQRRLQDFIHLAMEASVAHNLDAAKDFLARNAADKGVHTTPSGLQYKVLAAGDPKAASPTLADQVTVHYRGTLLDGSEFDSTYARGQPATFALGGMIKGWAEALTMMKPGAKWKLFIPPELGYGTAARPEIPGGSVLIFEVQLISVKSPAAAPSTAPPAPAPRDPAPALK
jgi:FKBP-type peptidyl-prolyl cis-trans isomerase